MLQELRDAPTVMVINVMLIGVTFLALLVLLGSEIADSHVNNQGIILTLSVILGMLNVVNIVFLWHHNKKNRTALLAAKHK